MEVSSISLMLRNTDYQFSEKIYQDDDRAKILGNTHNYGKLDSDAY